jgi:hypothetical protein
MGNIERRSASTREAVDGPHAGVLPCGLIGHPDLGASQVRRGPTGNPSIRLTVSRTSAQKLLLGRLSPVTRKALGKGTKGKERDSGAS